MLSGLFLLLPAFAVYQDKTNILLLSLKQASTPAPSAAPTIWDEISCTSALVHQTLIITGNLHVNGRIQLLASSNLTVYEEAEEGDNAEIKVKTNQLSKFATERCSHTVVPETPGGTPVFRGNLMLPHSNLIIGGEALVVGGTIKAKGITADGAGIVIVNGLHLRDDPGTCPRGQPTTLKVEHGMVLLKNGSVLLSNGRIEAPAVGLDRGSILINACGGIEAIDSKGETPGDVAVLGSSSLITQSESSISAQSLIVGENSVLKHEGALQVDSLKVAGYAAATVNGGPVTTDLLLVTSGSNLRITGASEVKAATAVVLAGGGSLRVDSSAGPPGELSEYTPHSQKRTTNEAAPPLNLTVGAIEISDGASLTGAASGLHILNHLLMDDFSTLDLSGEVDVGGWASFSNFSKVSARDKLTVRETMKTSFGSSVSTRHLQVGCNLVASGGSKVTTVNLTLRKDDNGPEDECGPLIPAFVGTQNAELEAVYAWVNGTFFLDNRSNASVVSLTQPAGATIIKKESKLLVKVSYPRSQFLDVGGLANVTITSPGNTLELNGLRVADSSHISLTARSISTDWMDIHSKSNVSLKADEISVAREVAVEEVSTLSTSGGTLKIDGALLSAVRSKILIGDHCSSHNLISDIHLRDGSDAILSSGFSSAARLSVELLSGSTAELACPVKNGHVDLSISDDSDFKCHRTWLSTSHSINLAVSPSESVGIKYLTPKTMVQVFNKTAPTSAIQRKTKASGWKAMEEIQSSAAAEQLLPVPVNDPIVAEDPLANAATNRRISSGSTKRRKKDD